MLGGRHVEWLKFPMAFCLPVRWDEIRWCLLFRPTCRPRPQSLRLHLMPTSSMTTIILSAHTLDSFLQSYYRIHLRHPTRPPRPQPLRLHWTPASTKITIILSVRTFNNFLLKSQKICTRIFKLAIEWITTIKSSIATTRSI